MKKYDKSLPVVDKLIPCVRIKKVRGTHKKVRGCENSGLCSILDSVQKDILNAPPYYCQPFVSTNIRDTQIRTDSTLILPIGRGGINSLFPSVGPFEY